MTTSLLQTFEALDQASKEALADLSSPRHLSLAALLLANDKCRVSKLTAEHITACLEAAGVAVSRISVSRALANARGAVATSKNLEGETQYRLMIKGRREIEPILGSDRVVVVRIEANQPRTARLRLRDILTKVRGTVRVCDPYFGLRTLDSLDMLPAQCHIKMLTAKTNESAGKLKGALADFTRERPQSEFRLVGNKAGIHDRYVVTTSRLLILGHGLKDIGGKESFIISIDVSLAGDIVADTIRSFECHWTNATPM